MKSTQLPEEVMDMTILGNTYSGPNYPTAKAEARANRKSSRYSWFDNSMGAFMLALLVVPLMVALSHNPMRSECHTTATWCSVQGGAVTP